LILPLADIGDTFTGAVDFIFNQRESFGGGTQVGGLDQCWEFMWNHIVLSSAAMGLALAVALPFALWLGHRGRGEFAAVSLGNAGRALPELVLIAFLVAYVGVGFLNLAIALSVLAIPPILTNTYVGIRQADPVAVEAARGMGMSERSIALRVELPLAAPTIMAGVRTGAINVIATATIAPLAGYLTLGDFIINRNVYGDEGVVAGAILVALLALTVELLLAGVQRLLTPRGLKMARAVA
jgi:osmoprotectant transport system permease protein